MSVECVCGASIPLWDLRRHAGVAHVIYNCDLLGRHRPLIDYMLANRIRFTPSFSNRHDEDLWMRLLPCIDFEEDGHEYIHAHRENKKDLGGQNVHDSGITKSIVEVTKKLKDKTKIVLSNDDVIEEIVDHDRSIDECLSKYTDDRTLYQTLGMTMMGVLSLVWHNVRINLENRFASFKSNIIDGWRMCTTGRISRMIDALSGIDEDVKLLSSVDYMEEMLSKGSAIRNKFKNNPSITEEENNATLVSLIREAIHKDYDGILGIVVTDRFLDQWVNDIL